MNKIIYFSIIILISSCATKTPPKIEVISEPKFYIEDSIVFWKMDNLKKSEIYSFDEMLPLSMVKKRYKINKGGLFDIQLQEYVSNVVLQLRTSEFMGKDVKIVEGLPFGSYCDFTNGVTCRMDIQYDELGNMNGFFSVENYNTTFENGKGYWKDFYNEKQIKEEGQVKNNFKVGEWKYYNKKGSLDSLKTYTLKDSVDVRFPHCLFNKIEPCD